MASERFAQLIERIDQLNRQDPNTELVDGVRMPREYVYSQRLTGWVLRLEPTASEALRIAARGQHIQRWTIPRDRYERNRRGYLRWRETLKTFHAQQVTELMAAVGYPDETIQQVRSLIVKRRPPDDPEAQVLEDALCLVFFETQFADLRMRTPEPAMEEALRKMWKKMSERGRAEALRLPLLSFAKIMDRNTLDFFAKLNDGILHQKLGETPGNPAPQRREAGRAPRPHGTHPLRSSWCKIP